LNLPSMIVRTIKRKFDKIALLFAHRAKVIFG
jgi:hypothetical protein